MSSLVFTRNAGTSFMIGDDITVTILAISANQVKVQINAPREVPVHRTEVYERIVKERAQ